MSNVRSRSKGIVRTISPKFNCWLCGDSGQFYVDFRDGSGEQTVECGCGAKASSGHAVISGTGPRIKTEFASKLSK